MRALSLIAGLLFSAFVTAQATDISQQQFSDLPNKVLLDVRTPEEFAEGHVPGAVNMPYDQLASFKQTLDGFKDNNLVVYCRSGRRAAVAVQWLQEQGFEQLYHLDGDMLGWQEAKLPIEK